MLRTRVACTQLRAYFTGANLFLITVLKASSSKQALLKMLQIPKFSKALEARVEHLAQHTNGTQTFTLAISSAGVTVPNCDASVPLLTWSWD